MFGRTALFWCLLISAVAIPYLVSESGPLHQPFQALIQRREGAPWKDWFAATPTAPSEGTVAPTSDATRLGSGPATGSTGFPTAATPTLPVSARRPVAPTEAGPTLGGPPGMSLAEALRFDVTPAWVSQNWARVTTQLPTTDYHGVRVPLVTGLAPEDFTGSLSYYFNSQGQVERISLWGTTADYEPLAALIQQRFGMQQYASVGTALYLGFWQGRPLNYLRIEEAPVIQADQPAGRYRVELELNQVREGAGLSVPLFERLRQLRGAGML